MGKLVLIILVGAVAYYYLKQRKESIDKAVKFDREVAEVKREREEE
jgi:hypothetical protein